MKKNNEIKKAIELMEMAESQIDKLPSYVRMAYVTKIAEMLNKMDTKDIAELHISNPKTAKTFRARIGCF